MKRRTRLALSAVSGVLAAAVALLALASVRADAARASEEAAERYGGELTSVCVATRDIEVGETIDEANTSVEEWVSTMLPAQAITSLRDAAGKTATSRIPERAPLSTVYFGRQADGFEVPSGCVAVSVASDAQHALGGSLSRGQRVDVYVAKDGIADRLCSADVLDTSALAQGGGEISWVTLGVEAKSVSELLSAAERSTVFLAAPGSEVAAEAEDAEDEPDKRQEPTSEEGSEEGPSAARDAAENDENESGKGEDAGGEA